MRIMGPFSPPGALMSLCGCAPGTPPWAGNCQEDNRLGDGGGHNIIIG